MPVFLAAMDGRVDLLRMLLEAGAVPNIDTKVLFHDNFWIKEFVMV